MKTERRHMGARVIAGIGLTLLGGALAPGADRTIEVTASRYVYEPERIEVDQGDRVTLVLHSEDTTHGLEIREYDVKVSIPKDGSRVSVEFVADKPGEFRFRCSVYCGAGHRDMSGMLVVRPRPS